LTIQDAAARINKPLRKGEVFDNLTLFVFFWRQLPHMAPGSAVVPHPRRKAFLGRKAVSQSPQGCFPAARQNRAQALSPWPLGRFLSV